MIAKIYYEDTEGEFIIDCSCYGIKEDGRFKALLAVEIGEKDTYLRNRPLTRAIGTDAFFLPFEDVKITSDTTEDELRDQYPEYFL